MSSNYWQIKKQNEQFKHGNTLTSKIDAYVKVWERRCYSDGIPDEVPNKIMDSGRAPSYKALAIAILKNDLVLKGLGFEGVESTWYSVLRDKKNRDESRQYDMF